MRYFIATIIIFFFYGCTGKVQTNPVPEQNEIYVPGSYEMTLKNDIHKDIMKEYDLFVKKTLVEPKEANKNIWELGMERSIK